MLENCYSDNGNKHRSLNPGFYQWPKTPSAFFLVPRCFGISAAVRLTLRYSSPVRRCSPACEGWFPRSSGGSSVFFQETASESNVQVRFPLHTSGQPRRRCLIELRVPVVGRMLLLHYLIGIAALSCSTTCPLPPPSPPPPPPLPPPQPTAIDPT